MAIVYPLKKDIGMGDGEMSELKSMESVLNLAEAMNNLDGDGELLEEIVDIFMETAPQQLESLGNCISINEIDVVAMNAHGMKGGASNFCAKRFVAAALKLELKAKTGSLEGAEVLLDEMKGAFEEMKEVIQVVNWQEVQRDWDS